MEEMIKVASHNKYNYWVGQDAGGKKYYNITPESQPAPRGGYCKEWILGVKKVPDLFPDNDPFDELIKKLKK